MTALNLRDLVGHTFSDPAHAARTLIDLRLRNDVLIMAMIAACMINTILLFGPRLIVGAQVPMPTPLNMPFPYFSILTVGLAVLICVLYAVGRTLGGTGQVQDVAVVMIWLQIFGEMIQIVLLLLQFLLPAAAYLMAVGISLYTLFIALHFINQAHHLPSLGRAAIVLILSFFGIVFAVSMMLGIFGITSIGEAASHV